MNRDEAIALTAHHMRAAMAALDEAWNGCAEVPTVGIVILTFPLNEQVDGRVNYISNAAREDMLVLFKEIAARWEGRLLDAPEGIQ